MINSFLGLGASLLLKDNIAIAWIVGALVISTVIFIERAWLNENLFRKRRSYSLIAYSVLTITFVVGLYLVTGSMRKTSAIITSTSSFMTGIKAGDYKTAYTHLSAASQSSYPLASFVEDHVYNRIKIEEFTIDQVTFNKFDSKKAVAIVSSPFTIYGHETINLELVKEEGIWRVVLSRNVVVAGKPLQSPNTKRKGGTVSNFLNSIF